MIAERVDDHRVEALGVLVEGSRVEAAPSWEIEAEQHRGGVEFEMTTVGQLFG